MRRSQPRDMSLIHRYVYVIGMFCRRVALGCVRAPAVPGHPDLAEPDHVENAEGIGVRHAPGGEPVAVVARVTGGDAAETVRVGREVAGSAEWMLAPCGRPPTRRVVGEAGQ